MQNFRTHQLAKELFRKSRNVKLRAPYKDQFERAMLSVPLNLAEGSGRDSNADRRRFYQIALGSLREVQALIDILEINELKKDADVLGGLVYSLCRSLAPR